MTYQAQNRSGNPAADAAALLNRMGLALIGIVVPCLLAGTRRPVFILMPVGAALILIAALLDPASEGPRHLRNALASPIVLTLALFTIWCLGSLLWAPFRADTALRFGKLIGTLALTCGAAAFLPERTKTSNLYLPPIGVALAGAFALGLAVLGPRLLKLDLGGEDSTLERSAIALATLLWPVMGALALRERWIASGLLALLVMVVAGVAGSQLALLALIAGVLTFALAMKRPGQAAWLIGGLVALLFLAAPGLPYLARAIDAKHLVDPSSGIGSVFGSLEIWRGILSTDGWRILTGHGLDAASRGTALGFLPKNAPSGLLFELWFDLGVLGIVLTVTFTVQVLVACSRMGPHLAPFMIAGYVSALLIAMVDFSISQLWWVNVLGIAGIEITHIVRGQYLVMRPKLKRTQSNPELATA